MSVSDAEMSFARANASLRLQLLQLGAYPPKGVDVNLCEDMRTVHVTAEDGRGHWVGAAFELAEPTSEEEFFAGEAQRYREIFEQAPAEQLPNMFGILDRETQQ